MIEVRLPSPRIVTSPAHTFNSSQAWFLASDLRHGCVKTYRRTIASWSAPKTGNWSKGISASEFAWLIPVPARTRRTLFILVYYFRPWGNRKNTEQLYVGVLNAWHTSLSDPTLPPIKSEFLSVDDICNSCLSTYDKISPKWMGCNSWNTSLSYHKYV